VEGNIREASDMVKEQAQIWKCILKSWDGNDYLDSSKYFNEKIERDKHSLHSFIIQNLNGLLAFLFGMEVIDLKVI
jgi:hypothetical protein